MANKPLINVNPGDSESLSAGLIALFKLNGLKTDKLVPARIVQFDRAQNQATIQPLIMWVDTNDNTTMRPPVARVPVISLGGGGFHISFPLKEGDLGWILASDRDISLFLQSLQASPPNTMRQHSFSDAWFIPDVFRNYTISGEDADSMVIQSVDASTRIAIKQGFITITAPTGVKVVTPTAEFSKDVKIDGNLTVTGLTTVNGGFNANGSGSTSVTLPENSTIGGINVFGHGHEQNGTSGRTSGGMEA